MNQILKLLWHITLCSLSNKICCTLFEDIQGELCPTQPSLVKARSVNLGLTSKIHISLNTDPMTL